MSIEKSSKSEDVLELHQVIDHLAQAEAALSALMQGQVDAYINPATATPRLLNEAQDWLLRSQQRLKQIHDAIACGVIVRDSNGVIVHANDLASKMLGIPLRQIVGRKYLDMPVPIIREDGSPFLSDEYPGIIAFQTGKLVRDVIMGVLNGNDQAVRWLLVTAQPLADPDDGRVTDVVTTLVDISQRVQAEKRVLQERQRIEVLLDLSPVGILVTDASGCILLTNQEMHRLWGLPLQIGEPLDAYYQSVTLKQSNGSVYPPEQFPLERAISNGEQVWAEEVHIELADGTVIPTLVNATLIYSGDGKFAGAILIMQDISALEEMNKLRTEFLGMVSHELKNP